MAVLSIAPLTDRDLSFVREMLYEAAFWRGTNDAPPINEALNAPGLRIYIEEWGRPGDDGLVASIGDDPAGAVWVRRFSEEAHGYGYVDELTPELSIAVTNRHRGSGVGRCLMTAILAELRLQTIAQMSLSVEDDNPARQLYQSLGFVTWATADGASTMLRTLP
ncbi:MAG: GNAT family N-acetyltransferase [Intrasporangiaceae bacterium]|nr:GNAT family N-acetyltransferase [Intrasporangiaceae bacterium]